MFETKSCNMATSALLYIAVAQLGFKRCATVDTSVRNENNLKKNKAEKNTCLIACVFLLDCSLLNVLLILWHLTCNYIHLSLF